MPPHLRQPAYKSRPRSQPLYKPPQTAPIQSLIQPPWPYQPQAGRIRGPATWPASSHGPIRPKNAPPPKSHLLRPAPSHRQAQRGGAVAQNATLDNAINLRDVNLIGIYGGSSDRRALVRLGNGRYVRVTVGDRLDGGRVTAISAGALSYTKSGRALTLEVAG